MFAKKKKMCKREVKNMTDIVKSWDLEKYFCKPGKWEKEKYFCKYEKGVKASVH